MGIFSKRPVTETDDDEEARWAEKRAEVRHDVEVRVDVSTPHNFYQGFTENISEGGLFVSTYRRLPVGSALVVQVHLDDGEAPVEVTCEVRWTRDDSEDDAGGMGMRFVSLEAAARARIAAFVARRDPLFYED